MIEADVNRLKRTIRALKDEIERLEREYGNLMDRVANGPGGSGEDMSAEMSGRRAKEGGRREDEPMIGELPWTAASAVGAALAGCWTIAWLTFHRRGKDGSSMKERYERAEARARDAESRYEEVRGKAEESEKLARRRDGLRQDLEDLQRESSGLDGAREALDKFASEEEAKVREIAREGEQARDKRDRIRVETDGLERANKALQEQIETKGRQFEELERRAGETADTEAEIAKKVKELENIEARERESRMRASMAVEEVGEEMAQWLRVSAPWP